MTHADATINGRHLLPGADVAARHAADGTRHFYGIGLAESTWCHQRFETVSGAFVPFDENMKGWIAGQMLCRLQGNEAGHGHR